MITTAGVPVYAQEKLDPNIEPDHPTWQFLSETLKVKSVEEIVQMYHSGRLDLTGYELLVASQRRNHTDEQIKRSARMLISVCSYE